MTSDRYRVLILEDEESMNRGIAFSAERHGFLPIQCYTIKDAEKSIEEHAPDVIICDINLPDGSGLDFISSLRSRCMSRRPYIICLTALDTETDHVLGYEAGADDYISKPFSLSVLMLKLEAFARRNVKQDATPKVIVSGNLRFVPDKMEVTVDGTAVQLTRNECRLLGAFMRNPQQILSRDQLLMQAFDIYENFVDENTLAVNISRLREKLCDNAQNPEYIRNIRGLGYIWMKELQQ